MTTWHGCYDGNWNGQIVPEAFSHPAKMANGLVNRIFDYAFEHGWLRRGDVVVDPFGGIGSTAIIGASRGVRVLCCELEQKFVDLAKQNFELHRRTWEACGDPMPVIVQGDSRRLCDVLGPHLADLVVSSPPFQESLGRDTVVKQDRVKLARELGVSNAEHISPIDMERIGKRNQEYGVTAGQLGSMPAGSVDSVISSPPYAESVNAQSHGIDWSKAGPATGNRQREGSKCDETLRSQLKYADCSQGQLGAMPAGSVEAVISSPPFLDARSDTTNSTPTSKGGDCAARIHTANSEYGTTPGNLGNLPSGDVDAIVSSPPFDGQVNQGGAGSTNIYRKWCEQNGRNPDTPNAKMLNQSKQWGNADGQLGNETGDTFWSAAREIVLQCHQILRPGGVAIWVCKDFIRKGQRVPFSSDWQRLCVSCGFEPVEWIKASLVKEISHPGLFGEDVVTRTERKGFFRRLAEKKGSPPIDEEDVIIVRKPDASNAAP